VRACNHGGQRRLPEMGQTLTERVCVGTRYTMCSTQHTVRSTQHTMRSSQHGHPVNAMPALMQSVAAKWVKCRSLQALQLCRLHLTTPPPIWHDITITALRLQMHPHWLFRNRQLCGWQSTAVTIVKFDDGRGWLLRLSAYSTTVMAATEGNQATPGNVCAPTCVRSC
jgi:hypothetical protein